MSEETQQTNEINMLGGFESQTYSESPLIYYSNSSEAQGIYIEWERYTLTGVSKYNILRSSHIDGPYSLVGSVDFPQNDYVDEDGLASSYYKIQEVNASDVVITTSQPINGDELLIKSSLRHELLHLLNVPIYDEEVIFNKDRTKATVAFSFWNYTPRPQVRITGYSSDGNREPMIILSEYETINQTINGPNPNYPDGLKIKLDYKGTIYFIDENDDPVEIHPYDTVIDRKSVV